MEAIQLNSVRRSWIRHAKNQYLMEIIPGLPYNMLVYQNQQGNWVVTCVNMDTLKNGTIAFSQNPTCLNSAKVLAEELIQYGTWTEYTYEHRSGIPKNVVTVEKKKPAPSFPKKKREVQIAPSSNKMQQLLAKYGK